MEREDIIHYLKTAEWHTARFGANVRFFRGDTLVRYIEIPFFDGMEDAVNWLNSEEGCEEIFVDGKRPDIRWKPLRAWYEDSGTFNNRSWRLYHVVRNADDDAADGPYTVEDGCVYKEEHTFFWRTAEVMEVPKGSSGISYSLQGIRRDEESGLFSYVLVKRERVQVNVGPWLSHQELGETRESALLLGVREEEGSSVDEKVEAFASEHQMKTTDGDGSVVDIQKSKNDDCTTDVTLVNTKEEAVLASSETIRVSALSKATRKTDHNQSAPGEEPTAEQGKIVTVTNEKTPGGLHNVTTEAVESIAVEKGKADVACAKTIFEHEHRETARNQKTRVDEATEAGGGKVHRTESRLNEDNTFDNSEIVTEELKVEAAQKVEEEERFEKVVSVMDANKPSGTALPDFTPGALMRKELRKNPGGSVTENTTTRTAKEGTIEFSFKTDARGRTRHYAWFRNLTQESYLALAAKYTDGSVSINAFGLYDGTLARIDSPDGGSGDIPGWETYEETFETQSVSTTYHKGNGTAYDPDGWYIAIEKLTVVAGVLNDNAAAAYAKVSGSLRPPKVTQLSTPTMQNKGWYSYSYVSNVTYTRMFIPGDTATVSQTGTIS